MRPPNPCFCYPGVKLTGLLFVEAGLLLLNDAFEYSLLSTPVQRAVADGRGFRLVAEVSFPLSDALTVNARAGAVHWSVDAEDSAEEESDSDVTLGIGIEYAVRDSLGVQLRYDAYRFSDVDVDTASIGLRYRF